MWREEGGHLHSPSHLDTAFEILLQEGGTRMSLHLSWPQPWAEEKGSLTMRTAAMGMAVFMKTVEEAQGEVRGGTRGEQGGHDGQGRASEWK